MSVLLLILVCVLQVSGLYENADVVHLNVDNFDRLVTRGTDTWVVQFYSPYCPYCQEFAPSFEKAASILKGSNVKVGVVDADEDKTLLRRYEVKGIPNVKIYHPKNPIPETYSGPRTTEALVQKISALKKMKRYSHRNKEGWKKQPMDYELKLDYDYPAGGISRVIL